METFEETTETLAEGGSPTPDDTTLKEVPEVSVLDGESQENRARVCDDVNGGAVSVVTTRVVETEISLETSSEVENTDGVDDDGKVKNGSYSLEEIQENGEEVGVEDDGKVKNESYSSEEIHQNGEEVGIEHGGGGENVNGSASVLGVDKKDKEGVEHMAVGEGSPLLVGDNIEGPKAEIEVKEGRNLDNGASLNENGGDSDSSMLNVSGEKDDEGDDADEEEGYEFSVGDFVWGKIKHHPWWPGQIYDPSDASEYALKLKRRDRYLVAYSGDGTFAWCYPSQLKPFEENFVEFSKQSNSKKFINAVEAVLEEIARLVEWKMTCSCVLRDNQIGLTRPIAKNAGVKEGVYVPESGNAKLSQFEPAQILAELKYISQVVSVGCMLELTVLKSKLSVFYKAKGGYQLPVYHLPQYIIGLADDIQTGLVNNGDCNEQVDVPNQGRIKEDWLSSPGPHGFDNTIQSTLQKTPSISEDKLYQRRKQKSIAEIIRGQIDVEPNNKGKDVAKEGADFSKPASTSRGRNKKRNDEAERHGGTTLTTSSGMRKKPKLEGVPTSTDKDVSSVENGGGWSGNETKKGPVSKKNKENRNSSDETDGVEMGYSPRERKKSKYLSPPFTNPQRQERNSSSSKREAEVGFLSVTSSALIGERMSKAAGQLFASTPILKCNAETHKKKLPKEPGAGHDISGSPIPPTPKPAQKMVVDPIVTQAPAKEVLSKIRYAALGHLYLREPKSLDMIRVFFSTFRNAIFHNGSYYKEYNKRRPGRKRKSIDPESGSLAKDPNQTDQNSPDSKAKKTRIKKNEAKSDMPKYKQGKAVDRSESKKPEKGGTEGKGSSAALFLTFGQEVSLPSKDDLIATYSKFGPLNKSETDVMCNSFCAQVVFVRGSDAEQAFKHSMSLEKDDSITYRLRYLNPGSKIQELDDSPHQKASSLPKDGADACESSSLESVKQKLEMMTSMVDKSDGNMSHEMKNNLEGELKDLLEKVSTMG